MEAINSGILDLGVLFSILKKILLGTVAFGFFVGGIYFALYLIRLYRLPRQSKEYRHQKQHLQAQNLIRYIITISCLLLISGLFYFYIEIGKQSMHIGALLWMAYYSFKYVKQKLKNNRVDDKTVKVKA